MSAAHSRGELTALTCFVAKLCSRSSFYCSIKSHQTLFLVQSIGVQDKLHGDRVG